MNLGGRDIKGSLHYYKWISRYTARQIYWRWKYAGEKLILGRYACLGTDVIRILQPSHRIVNVQKGRVDYLVECWNNPSVRARTPPVIQHMQREEIIGCIMQEEILCDWLTPRQPIALFMDSMAEHGDQLFQHKGSEWNFLCSYTDLAHTEKFKDTYHNKGLLPIEDLHKCFGIFFEAFRSRFGKIPIFYLHFSAKLEKRQKFRERYFAIRQAIDSLSSEFQPLYSIAVDEDVVDWCEERTPEIWDFPYHYNRRTYKIFSEMVRATGAWPG